MWISQTTHSKCILVEQSQIVYHSYIVGFSAIVNMISCCLGMWEAMVAVLRMFDICTCSKDPQFSVLLYTEEVLSLFTTRYYTGSRSKWEGLNWCLLHHRWCLRTQNVNPDWHTLWMYWLAVKMVPFYRLPAWRKDVLLCKLLNLGQNLIHHRDNGGRRGPTNWLTHCHYCAVSSIQLESPQ